MRENENYDYCIPLMEYFLGKSDNIEIHCWNDENGVIDEIKSRANESFDMFTEEHMTIFKGSKAKDFAVHMFNKL